LRAQELLADLRLGIAPDWPAECQELARGYDRLPANERPDALRRLHAALGVRGVLFLLGRLDDREANTAWELLRGLKDTDAPARILAACPQPATAGERRAVAWALQMQGKTLAALALAEDQTRRELVEQAVRELRALWEKKDHAALAAAAQEYAKLAPVEARFRYLAAEGLEAGGATNRAAELRAEALTLQPDAEAPHYTAGEMLRELKRDALAALEWQRILDIPPAGDVYDVNAWLQLGQLQARRRQFAEAADLFEKALKAIEGRPGFGLVGASVKEVADQIARWRQLAGQDLLVEVETVVTGGKQAEFDKAFEAGAWVLTLRIEPRDVRLFDLPAASLRYDPATKTIGPFLNGKPCAEPVALALTPQKNRVLARLADCFYLYEVDLTTGAATQKARYELDFKLRVVPGPRLAGWRNLHVTVNGEEQNWARLRTGVVLDHLPATLVVEVTGTDAAGQPATARYEKETGP
jgi:tetratricopeptide (TPR) repeat protein